MQEEINAQNNQNEFEENQLEDNQPIFRNRSQRRKLLKLQGALKAMKQIPLKQWMNVVKTNQQEGKKLKNQHLDENEKKNTSELEEKMENSKAVWKELGYSPSEIEKLEEAHSILNLRDKENWQEEKSEARRLMKEAEQSKTERLKNKSSN